MNQQDEKRDYYRVAEPLCIYLEPISPDTGGKKTAADWFPYLNAPIWLDEFQTLHRELQRDLAGFNQETASAMKKLMRQNELLTGALVKSQAQPGLTITDISEGGVAFESDKTYSCGQQLAVALFLNTRALPLYCFARVVRVTPVNSPHRQLHLVAVGFEGINATERDSLARQVLQSQRKRGSQS